MDASNKIPCTFVPVKKFNLLLPNSAIAEIVVTRSIETISNTPQWLIGEVKWQNQNIKVIDFKKIDSSNGTVENKKSIILIVRNPSAASKVKFFGILIKSTPQIMEANSHNINKDLHPPAPHSHAKSYVTINGKEALIPNIELLANMIEDIE